MKRLWHNVRELFHALAAVDDRTPEELAYESAVGIGAMLVLWIVMALGIAGSGLPL